MTSSHATHLGEALERGSGAALDIDASVGRG
jgi:hypothetical protein